MKSFSELQDHMTNSSAATADHKPGAALANRPAPGAALTRGSRAGSPTRPSRLSRVLAEPIRSKRELVDPEREANLALLAKQKRDRVPLGESTLLYTRVEAGRTPQAYYSAKARAARTRTGESQMADDDDGDDAKRSAKIADLTDAPKSPWSDPPPVDSREPKIGSLPAAADGDTKIVSPGGAP